MKVLRGDGLHICMITPEYPPTLGGVGGYVSKLSLKLVEKGFRVSVITRGGWKGSIENPTRDLKIYYTDLLGQS